MPVELEIGTGKGHFLAAMAKMRPDSGFVGIEQSKKWAHHAADRVLKADLGNVRIVHAEAMWFMGEYVATASVAAIHIYFPDPWPKRKHEKRRLWDEPFVTEILRVLAERGRIYVATDVKAYFLFIQETLSRITELTQAHLPRSWPVTGYTRKYLAAGRPVFGTMFVKRETQCCALSTMTRSDVLQEEEIFDA